VRTRSDSKLSSPPRGHTIAFRLSGPERDHIDDLARGERITPSEFARRAVFGDLDAITDAMEEALERGRDDMRSQIAGLEEKLSRAQSLLTRSRASERDLYKRLTQAPDELTAAIQQLAAGTPGCQVIIATCWSRMDPHDRCKAIPIIATMAAAEVNRVTASLRFNDADCESLGELVSRHEWLMEALTPDSGRSFASAGERRRPEWAPLETSLRRAAEWLLRCRSAIRDRETESLATDVGETSTSDSDAAIATQDGGAITTEVREAIATEVREAIATTVHQAVARQARAAVEIEADRTRAAERLATTIFELAAAMAADAELMRARETSAEAAAEIDATSAAEFRATAAVASQAGNVALPTIATSAIASEPPVVRRVPLGVISGRAALAGSVQGYLDVAGRHHDWPKAIGATA
jgi:hypothetical protein